MASKVKVNSKKISESDLWCVYYYSKKNSLLDFTIKKKFCKSLYLAYKVTEDLMLSGYRVSSIERLDCIIDY